MRNILVTLGKHFAPEAIRILKKIGKVAIIDESILTQDSLCRIIPRFDIVVTGLTLLFDRRTLFAARKLKLIACAATGIDHIDVVLAEARGIRVMSLRGETKFLSSITSTAELSLGLMIALSRNFHGAIASVHRGQWKRELFRGHSLAGKTLGIIGMGRLGTWMARYGRALNMNVIFFDPYVKGPQKTTWKKILSASDVLSLHVPLNRETENLMDRRSFKLMKRSAHLINTSRGKIVNERDLILALRKGLIAGYAADVLSGEPFKNRRVKHSLVEFSKKHPNVIITPHIGGMTEESREATDIFIAEKVKNFILST